ncbi:MAG TPA: hypothetical protein VLJ59_08205 [Mycobacteriales bacterium]|nr:hypothetical protein [Mycobacteriales bacterium]
MADGVDLAHLQELEQRLATLEAQSGQPSGGSEQGSGGVGMTSGQGQAPSPEQQGLMQAFLQGAMAAQALAQAAAQQAGQAGQAVVGAQGGAAPAGFTSYDSIFWCRSRFMCNPQSISCFC